MWELFSVEPQVKSQWTVLVGYLTISANLLAVMKRFVDNNIICLSGFSNTATQLMHAPVHGVRNTVQQLLRKTQSLLLSYVPPTGQSWTQLITRFTESMPAWIWVSTKLTKSGSDWLNCGKAVIQHFSEKDAIFVSVLCQVVQKH